MTKIISEKSNIVLEYLNLNGGTVDLEHYIKLISSILVPVYTKTEVEFAQKNPDAVEKDFMLKDLYSIINLDNETDWDFFYTKVKVRLEDFFEKTDWVKSSSTSDINIFVSAKDAKTGSVIGIIQFLISPNFGQGVIKVGLFGTCPEDIEVAKQLMFSIFKIKPDTKKLFLHTRSTNQFCINTYKEWGFVETSQKLPNWIDLEYLINK